MMSSFPNPGIREVNIEGMRLSRKYGGLQEYVHVSPTFATEQFVVAVKPFPFPFPGGDGCELSSSTKHFSVGLGELVLLACVSNPMCVSGCCDCDCGKSSYDFDPKIADDCTFGRCMRIWKRRMMGR